MLAVVGGAHALAVPAVMACTLPVWLQVALVLLAVLSLSRFRDRYGDRRGRRFVRRLAWLADGSWMLETGDGCAQAGCLSACFVHPWLVILGFRTGRWRVRSLAIPADAAAGGDLRRLRLHLQVLRPLAVE